MENETINLIPDENLTEEDLCECTEEIFAEGEEVEAAACAECFESIDECMKDECCADCEEAELGEDEECPACDAADEAVDFMVRKYQEVKNAIAETANRLSCDIKQMGKNPYFKCTKAYTLELYRNEGDEEPIDTFHYENTKGASAKVLAVVGAASLVLTVATNRFVKKIFK